jgi:zinc D-Ala-D-Ala dipeptidase
MKPYQQVAIVECGEPLVRIPPEPFSFTDPHPYVKVGAPYGDRSPYYLRQGVVDRLLQAGRSLQSTHPGWKIQIFDAYRPLSVQAYMVDLAFQQAVQERSWDATQLTAAQRQAILEQVHTFWAVPNDNPATPPPHSTGAAVDVTLVDGQGRGIEMGSAIDEMSPRSYPDFFEEKAIAKYAAVGYDSREIAGSDRQQFQTHRQILNTAMTSAGFRQHLREWWHFSWGDQYWAWLDHQAHPQDGQARYGRAI